MIATSSIPTYTYSKHTHRAGLKQLPSLVDREKWEHWVIFYSVFKYKNQDIMKRHYYNQPYTCYFLGIMTLMDFFPVVYFFAKKRVLSRAILGKFD